MDKFVSDQFKNKKNDAIRSIDMCIFYFTTKIFEMFKTAIHKQISGNIFKINSEQKLNIISKNLTGKILLAIEMILETVL